VNSNLHHTATHASQTLDAITVQKTITLFSKAPTLYIYSPYNRIRSPCRLLSFIITPKRNKHLVLLSDYLCQSSFFFIFSSRVMFKLRPCYIIYFITHFIFFPPHYIIYLFSVYLCGLLEGSNNIFIIFYYVSHQ